MGSVVTNINLMLQYSKNVSMNSLRLLEATGCINDPEGELICLQKIPPKVLVNSMSFTSRGVIDGGRSINPVLPDAPETLMATGQFNHVKHKIISLLNRDHFSTYS